MSVDDGFIRSVVKICGNVLLINSQNEFEYEEKNPWMDVYDCDKPFWDGLEIEKKFDINGDIDVVGLITRIPETFKYFSFSRLNECIGNEHFVKLYNGNFTQHYAVLTDAYPHKSAKIKYPTEYEWVRRVRLCPFNEKDEIYFQQNLIGGEQYQVTRYPTIRKEKYRYILVDDEGWVWGLSISKARTYDDRRIKTELELEFWSRIQTVNSQFLESIDDVLNKLERYMRSIAVWLDEIGIKYVYPGEKKYDWFERNFRI